MWQRTSVLHLALTAGLLFACSSDPEPPAACAIEGAPCDDNNACTTRDICQGGRCTGLDPTLCTAADQCHTVGTCDPSTGACSNPSAANGTRCDDNNACTQSDTCELGACVGANRVVCGVLDDCHIAGSCDPLTGACSNPEKPSGASCNDGDACTRADTCEAGSCRGTDPVVCDGETACKQAGSCVAATGTCRYDDKPTGTVCDDGTVCTSSSACSSGACVGSNPITCTPPVCQRAVGCDPQNGCMFSALADNTTCDDSDPCTMGSVCSGGSCGGGSPVVCDTPGQCQLAGSCVANIGCVYPPRSEGFTCDDNSRCTLRDMCVNGTCVGGEPVVCEASDQCHAVGQCDPVTGDCSEPALANGAMCDDRSVCTRTDECQIGACVGLDPVVFSGTHCEDGICFTDTTTAAGITWTSSTTLVFMGAGAGFLDYDSDGWPDILLGTETSAPVLYRNRADGTFEDVSSIVGFPQFGFPTWLMGFSVADYDNDGDPDIYLVAEGPNYLLRNDDGMFTDVTATASVGDAQWSSGAAFADFDHDGDLDLYVGNYIRAQSYPFHGPDANTLYQNNGDGTFTDVTAQLGVGGAGTTLAVSWSDFDGDGWVDLLVCNDFGAFVQPNQLYRNSSGTFTEVSQALGFDIAIYCMGITAGDWDRDLDFDYYFSNLGRNVFLENTGPTGFADRTSTVSTTLTRDPCFTDLFTTSWGVGFHDFDSDSWIDLYVSNGYVPADDSILNARHSTNTVFKHQGPSLTFADISQSAGVDNGFIGRGVAFADYDRDGDVDILQSNIDGPPVLLRNDSPNQGRSLTVRTVGRGGEGSNVDGLHVRLQVDLPNASLIRESNRNYSFESASDPRVHFGLGSATSVPRLRLAWPSGRTQRLVAIPADSDLTVMEPLATITSTSVPPVVPQDSMMVVALGLQAHVSTQVDIAISVDLSIGGTSVAGSGGGFPLSGSTTTDLTIVVPAGLVTEATPARIVISVSDATGGLDQRAVDLTLIP